MNEVLEPGDFVVWSSENCLYYGFYKGLGNGTIQVLSPHNIIDAYKNNHKPRVDAIFGMFKDWRVIRSHPDFVTKDRCRLEEALKIIKETHILPIKY
jgi:hypothetical protein